MSDMEPGPCESCGEDLDIHTKRQLEQCVRGEEETDWDWAVNSSG